MKGRKPREIAEKKPVNQITLIASHLEKWVDDLAFCLTLFVLVDVTVGSQDAQYSRNLNFREPSEMVEAHRLAIRGYIHCIANRAPLLMEIPVPLYCLLAPLCDYEINCMNGRVSARYDLDSTWYSAPSPGMKSLFSRDGYYACKYGWKFYTSENYKTKQGRLKDVTYLTGLYVKEGTPVELRTRRVSVENYQFIDTPSGLFGHALRGSELTKELVMGHLRVLPQAVPQNAGVLKRLLPSYSPVIFESQDAEQRAMRATDVLLQGGSSSIMGICGVLKLFFNPDLAELGALSFIMPLLTSPEASLPGTITNLPRPTGIAAAIIAGVMTQSPTTVWEAIISANGKTITQEKFAKLCSTMARKSAGDTHLPINIADSVAAHRPVFALNTHRVGVEAGFIHQKPLFEMAVKDHSNKYGDAFQVILTTIAKQTTPANANASDPTAVTAGFFERVLKAIDNCTQELHDIMASAPMLSDDVMATPLSSKVLVQANQHVKSSNSWEYEFDSTNLHNKDDTATIEPGRAARISAMLRRSSGSTDYGWELFNSTKPDDSAEVQGVPSASGGSIVVGDVAIAPPSGQGLTGGTYTPKYVSIAISDLLERVTPSQSGTDHDQTTRRLFSRHARIISHAREVHFFSSCYIFPIVGAFAGAELSTSNLEALGYEQVGTSMADNTRTIAMGSVISANRDDPAGQRKQLIANVGKYAGLGSLFGKALNLGKKFVKSETGQNLLGKAAGLAVNAAANSDNKILRGAAGVIGHFIA